MKLGFVKFANPVRVGTALESSFNDELYSITLEQAVVIRIRAKHAYQDRPTEFAESCSSLFNAVYWTEKKELEVKDGRSGDPQAPRRGRPPGPSAA